MPASIFALVAYWTFRRYISVFVRCQWWSRTKETFAWIRRRKAFEAESKEEADADVREGGEEEGEDAEARERAARAAASIKEREREVQRALANSLRDRDKERQHHQRDEGVQHFNALLADLVRNPDLSWREAKKQLKKDHRYTLADLLSKDEKERLFGVHVSMLSGRRRDKLRSVLTELRADLLAWSPLRDQLRDHPSTPHYTTTEQMEREYREWVRDKQSQAKSLFRQLLAETRTLTHRSRAAVADNPAALAALLAPLQSDPRWSALESCSKERAALVELHLEELEKRGPPPPPTATEPARTRK